MKTYKVFKKQLGQFNGFAQWVSDEYEIEGVLMFNVSNKNKDYSVTAM